MDRATIEEPQRSLPSVNDYAAFYDAPRGSWISEWNYRRAREEQRNMMMTRHAQPVGRGDEDTSSFTTQVGATDHGTVQALQSGALPETNRDEQSTIKAAMYPIPRGRKTMISRSYMSRPPTIKTSKLPTNDYNGDPEEDFFGRELNKQPEYLLDQTTATDRKTIANRRSNRKRRSRQGGETHYSPDMDTITETRTGLHCQRRTSL